MSKRSITLSTAGRILGRQSGVIRRKFSIRKMRRRRRKLL